MIIVLFENTVPQNIDFDAGYEQLGTVALYLNSKCKKG